MASKPSSDLICRVCGAKEARVNYRAVSCEKCRVFFFRYTLGQFSRKECGNKCPIDSNTRTTCRPCRYKKCLDIGMRMDNVGQRNSSALNCVQQFSRDYSISQMAITHRALINYGYKVADRLRLAKSTVEFAGLLANFERFSSSGSGMSILESGMNMNFSILELLQQPEICSSRNSAVFLPIIFDPFVKSLYYPICYCRSATAFADFLGAIEEFNLFKQEDKVKFFKSNLMAYIILESLYQHFVMRKCNFKPYVEAPFMRTNVPDDYWRKRTAGQRSNNNTIIEMLLELDLTYEEFLLLRLVFIFNNSLKLSESGRRIAIQAKNKYILMLAEFKKDQLDRNGATRRMANLLSLIREAEEKTIRGEAGHAQMVMENLEGMGTRFAYEVHISGTTYEHFSSKPQK